MRITTSATTKLRLALALRPCLVPCGLKRAALPESLLSNVLDLPAAENLARRSGRHAHDARIYAENFRPVGFRNVARANQVQVPDLALARDVGGRFDVPTPVQVAAVIVGENQTCPHAALKRGQRGKSLLNLHAQRARVVAHRGSVAETMLARAVPLVGFGHDVAGRTSQVRRQAGQLPHVLVSDVVKRDGVEDFLLESNSRSVIERDRVSRLRLRESAGRVSGQLKFHFQRDSRFHISELCHATTSNARRIYCASRNADFLCQLKQTVSIGLFL